MTTTTAQYHDRHKMDLLGWEAFMGPFMQMQMVCLGTGELDTTFKLEMFTVLSATHGCAHCQAHGGSMLSRFGMTTERIQALWDFETNDEFTEAQKAAFRFCAASASCPNGVTAEHHEGLREHYNEQQIREIVAVVAISGLLNRVSDSIAVVTDKASADWATAHLADVGWSIGKHVGSDEERRPDL